MRHYASWSHLFSSQHVTRRPHSGDHAPCSQTGAAARRITLHYVSSPTPHHSARLRRAGHRIHRFNHYGLRSLSTCLPPDRTRRSSRPRRESRKGAAGFNGGRLPPLRPACSRCYPPGRALVHPPGRWARIAMRRAWCKNLYSPNQEEQTQQQRQHCASSRAQVWSTSRRIPRFGGPPAYRPRSPSSLRQWAIGRRPPDPLARAGKHRHAFPPAGGRVPFAPARQARSDNGDRHPPTRSGL